VPRVTQITGTRPNIAWAQHSRLHHAISRHARGRRSTWRTTTKTVAPTIFGLQPLDRWPARRRHL